MARREKITDGVIVHVVNRGVKKMHIYRQKSDLWRFLFNLYYLNSENVPENWARELEKRGLKSDLIWPNEWGEKDQMVYILAFTIMPNHFHLILKEKNKNGISRFMHKATMAYSKFINAKYEESGSLFQGKYKSIIVSDDSYFRYLAAYVMVKNTFELYPEGGLPGATKNFNKAYEWAVGYPFTSLADYGGGWHSPIIDRDILGEIFNQPSEFKKFAKDCILGMKFEKGDFME